MSGMNKIEKSKRIAALVEKAGAADFAIEVGCDHGIISLSLAEKEDIAKILATDISKNSLSKLESRLISEPEDSVYRKKISYMVNDGLKGLSFEQCGLIVIAGMGGRLIMHILEKNMELVAKTKQLILSPQSDLNIFREFLIEMNWQVSEDMIYEDEKYYTIFDIRPGLKLKEEYIKIAKFGSALKYGPDLIKQRNLNLKKKLEEDFYRNSILIDKLKNINISNDREGIRTKLCELKKENNDISNLLKLYM